jgi:hypothetical protein
LATPESARKSVGRNATAKQIKFVHRHNPEHDDHDVMLRFGTVWLAVSFDGVAAKFSCHQRR